MGTDYGTNRAALSHWHVGSVDRSPPRRDSRQDPRHGKPETWIDLYFHVKPCLEHRSTDIASADPRALFGHGPARIVQLSDPGQGDANCLARSCEPRESRRWDRRRPCGRTGRTSGYPHDDLRGGPPLLRWQTPTI